MKIKEFINRIKCKLFVCCRITCNESLEKLENNIDEVIEDIEEEVKQYDYYSNKVKNLNKNNNNKIRSSSV